MKVKIKDLEPNPFRDMDHYPINDEKIQSLTISVNQTGFWDNILARKRDGKIQIAYGHHRLVVLQGNFKPDHIVDIPVKDLDDATMIRIMANENDESWAITPGIINETVRVTYEFLKKSFFPKKVTHPYDKHEYFVFTKLPIPKRLKDDPENGYRKSPLIKQISNWLGGNWNEERIYYSLDRLKLIEAGTLDKEAVEKLPLDTAARHFTSSVKRLELAPEKQKKAAGKIVESQNFSEQSIHEAVMQEKYPYEEQPEKEKEFAKFIEECSGLVNKLNRKLETLIKFKADFDSKIYKETFARFEFDGSINMLQILLKKLLKEDK